MSKLIEFFARLYRWIFLWIFLLLSPRRSALPEEYDECTFEEWEGRPDQGVVLHCECCDCENYFAPGDGCVFRCRDNEGFSCGRYCCACIGGSSDNRCSECWCKARDADALRNNMGTEKARAAQ